MKIATAFVNDAANTTSVTVIETYRPNSRTVGITHMFKVEQGEQTIVYLPDGFRAHAEGPTESDFCEAIAAALGTAREVIRWCTDMDTVIVRV